MTVECNGHLMELLFVNHVLSRNKYKSPCCSSNNKFSLPSVTFQSFCDFYGSNCNHQLEIKSMKAAIHTNNEKTSLKELRVHGGDHTNVVLNKLQRLKQKVAEKKTYKKIYLLMLAKA